MEEYGVSIMRISPEIKIMLLTHWTYLNTQCFYVFSCSFEYLCLVIIMTPGLISSLATKKRPLSSLYSNLTFDLAHGTSELNWILSGIGVATDLYGAAAVFLKQKRIDSGESIAWWVA